MRTFSLLALPMALGISATAITVESKTAVTLEFRLIDPAESEGGPKGTKEMPVPGTRESVHVRPESVLGLKDLRGAVLNGSILSLQLTPEGRRKFAEATGRHVGGRLAIVVDGKLRLAPLIQEKIVTDTFSLGDAWSLAEAKSLAARINAVVREN